MAEINLNKFRDTNQNLEILAEECAEVIQIKSKIIRFGMFFKHPTEQKSNRACLNQEVGDFLAMVDILKNQGILVDEEIEIAKLNKFKKLEEWYR